LIYGRRSRTEREGDHLTGMEAGMERSMRVGRMSKLMIGAMLVVLSLALPSLASAAYSVPICGLYPGNDTWSQGRYCNTPSTQYPGAKGWYGFVGVGGGACGPIIPGDNPPPGMSGICVAPNPEPVWKYTRSGWESSTLPVATRVYVHPMSREWRWIYSGGSWYAISANRLFLAWRV
jgi:hypothetical protein